MASSIYVYSNIEEYEKYNKNLLGNEKFHNNIRSIFINPKTGKVIFLSEYKTEITVPVIIGDTIKHVFMPYQRYGQIEEVVDKYVDFQKLESPIAGIYQDDEIRWKHTTETNGVLEIRKGYWVKIWKIHLWWRKKTLAKLFTQRIIYSGEIPTGWRTITGYFYDMGRDRISFIL